MTEADRWALVIAGLRGEPWPLPAPLPGRLIVCADRPLTEDEMADITSPIELGRVLGIGRAAAEKLLQARATTEGESRCQAIR